MSDGADDNTKGPRVPPPPPRAQRRGLIAPPPVATPESPAQPPPDNMAKPNSGLQDLNFKVSPELHFAFKVTASLRKIPMKDLLEASFRAWQEQYGDDQTRALLPPKLDK